MLNDRIYRFGGPSLINDSWGFKELGNLSTPSHLATCPLSSSSFFSFLLFFLSSLLSRTPLPLSFSLFFSFSSSFSPSPLCLPAHHNSPSPFLSFPCSHMLRESRPRLRDRERAGSRNPRPMSLENPRLATR